MKTLREALNDAVNELGDQHDWNVDSPEEDFFPVLEKHIAQLLSQLPDAAAMRKAEVVRIAEELFVGLIIESGNSDESHHLSAWSFKSAESFVDYKESLK